MIGPIVDRDVYRVAESLVDSKKVVFFFTAMGTKISLYRPAIRRLNRRGYSCVVYDYPLEVIFSGDLPQWEELYSQLIADAQERLQRFKAQGCTGFYAYGVSLGTLLANKFTRDTPEISHVIFNLTYGDVATNIWTYRGVNKAKHQLIHQGYDEARLRQAIQYSDPIVNAPKLKRKRVLLHLSRTDRVLPYDQTKATKHAFEKAGLDFEYAENKYLGHFLAGAKNTLAINRIDRFFSKPPLK